MIATAVDVAIVVEVPQELADAVDGGVLARITSDLGDLMASFGVARHPVVEVRPAAPTGRVVVTVDGHPCAVPGSALAVARAYVRRPRSGDGDGARDGDLFGADVDREEVGEVLGLVCRAALSAEPALLVTEPTLGSILDLGISIIDAPPDGAAPLDPGALEVLVSRSVSASIDLFIEPTYLRELTSESNAADLFPSLREGLFAELGLPVPSFRLRPDATLRRRGFAVGLHAWRSIPRIGLSPETILADETVEQLASRVIDAEPATNPVTGRPGAITSGEQVWSLSTSGVATYGPIEYVVLAVAATVRQRASSLVTTEAVANLIEPLRTTYPALTDAVDELVPNGVIVPVVRDLIDDGLSIGNVRRILELLLRYETDEEVREGTDRSAYVRSGMREEVARQLVGGSNTLDAYLLDPEFERMFHRGPDDHGTAEDHDVAVRTIRAVVDDEVSTRPVTGGPPVILVADAVRRSLQAALRPQFPDVRILGYRDIPPDTNVRVVARLARGG